MRLGCAIDRSGTRRALCAVVAMFGVLAVLAMRPGAPLEVRAADHAVQIQDFAFTPSTLTVSAGDTVTWTNADSAAHTVSAEGGAFDSGNLDPGQGFAFTFTAPGTYDYRCDYHASMTGTVVVEAAPAAAPTQPPAAPTPPPAAPAPSNAPAASFPPNTAMPAPGDGDPPTAPLLIGLGLLALATATVCAPSRAARAPRRGRPPR